MTKANKLIISVGSNDDAEYQIELAQSFLRELFHDIEFSSARWSRAVPDGPGQFLNCIGVTKTTHCLRLVIRALKNIERRCGDSRRERKIGVVKLDLDVLLYGDEKHHLDDWERDYVKELLDELKKKGEL